MPAAKGQIRQIITENNISSAADVYALLKESFKDILRGFWRLKWALPSVMKRTRRGILSPITKGMAIPQSP